MVGWHCEQWGMHLLVGAGQNNCSGRQEWFLLQTLWRYYASLPGETRAAKSIKKVMSSSNSESRWKPFCFPGQKHRQIPLLGLY